MGDFFFQAFISVAVDVLPVCYPNLKSLTVELGVHGSCLLLAEVFSASSLYWEPRFDQEKELNPRFGGVGREEAGELQTLPRVGSAAAKGGTSLAASSEPGSAAA